MSTKIKEHVVTASGAARLWVTLGLSLTTMAVMAFFVIAYVREQQRQMCGLIVVLDEAYHETPPATTTGQHIADEVSHYRDEIGC